MSKKKDLKKTNAMRLLDTHKIDYEVLEYEWVEGHGSGIHVAEVLSLDPNSVFKTLVGKGDKTGPIVFCIPVAEELDLKQAARVSGNKSVELVAVKDLLGLTGYIRGGCSPVGMKKLFETYFDQTMKEKSIISISAGVRGLQMRLDPTDLAMVVKAHFAPLTIEHKE